MYEQISASLKRSGVSAFNKQQIKLLNPGVVDSAYPVSDLVVSATRCVVVAIQTLSMQVWGKSAPASIDAHLANLWYQHSVYPQGWLRPAQWDKFTGDYVTQDGWIRLHTNAAHHRKAALSVLGNPATPAIARDTIGRWCKNELEQAVVSAQGCAAAMRSAQDWLIHPQGRAVAAEPIIAWTEHSDVVPTLSLNSPVRPLSGLRVLDLTRVLAGPVCTRLLAALGANVLRIDPPEWEEDGVALEVTVGKRCAGMDLRNEAAHTAFLALVNDADVLVHGYRLGALEDLGLGPAQLRKINPRLIDIALNAYGWTGPWSSRRGFDSLVQMSTGIAARAMASGSVSKPVPLPCQALDHATGQLMAAATIHAVCQQVNEGRVLSARLSLARQARLLEDAVNDGTHKTSTKPFPDAADHYLPAAVEVTDWGPVKRLPLPFVVDGIDLGWTRPATKLRSAKPTWH